MSDETKPGVPASPSAENGNHLAEGGDDFERVHLRLSRRDAEALRKLAKGRDQTLSATVRFLLRSHLRGR
jgi:hypothetical protein